MCEAILHAKSNCPLIVDVVTNFRSNVEMHVVFVHFCAKTAADPPWGLGID